MPEIEVAGEPRAGLRVVADQTRPADYPGFYALVQESEWHSDSKKLTVWRGPDRPDERVPRKRLFPVDCRSVVVDPAGFYDCLPDLDELHDDAVALAEKMLNAEADQSAAMTWSSPEAHGDLAEDFGDDVWVTASFGDATAVNGDLVSGSRRARPPRGWVKTDKGGRLMNDSYEAEVEMEWLAEAIARELSETLKRPIHPATALEILQQEYGRDKRYFLWSSSSGDSEVWVSKKAWKDYEETRDMEAGLRREALDRRHREEIQSRRAHEAEARRFQEAENRERLRRGGFPLRQDWSPRGRFPGEESR